MTAMRNPSKREKKAATRLRQGPPRQWAVDVSVGSAFLTVGAGGVLALHIGAGAATVTPSLDSTTWWRIGVGVSGFFLLLGLYMLAAVYFRLPLPQTRAARETRAELTIQAIDTRATEPGYCLILVVLVVGRLDIDNATMNVRVPDFVRIAVANAHGSPIFQQYGGMERTSESLYADHRYETNYCYQSRTHLAAFTETQFWFRLDVEAPAEPFPFHFRVTASSLHGAVEDTATITPIPPDLGGEGQSGAVGREVRREHHISAEPDAPESTDAHGQE